MSVEEALECTMVEVGMCGSVFKTFLEEKLSPLLYPFNPNSVIIMDNAAIHHEDGVVHGLIRETRGVNLLPPSIQL